MTCALLLLLGLLGCGKASHTVGQLRAPNQANASRMATANQAGEPSPARPPATAGAGAPSRSGSAGAIASGSAGTSPPMQPETGGISGTVCFPNTVQAQRKRLDLYLMVDINFTLTLTGDWSMLTGGLIDYVGDERAQGTGVGIDFFGVLPPVTTIDCSPNFYSMPTVGVGLLPGNSSALETSVRRAIPLQGSPLQPALQGALTYARSRAAFYSAEAKQAVVLITDGFIDWSCGTNVRDVSNVAAADARRSPSVPTYVVALDMPTNLLDLLVNFEPLDAIAREGGSGQARRVDKDAPASEVRDTLLEIQRAAEPCDYFLPEQAAAAGSLLSLATSASAATPDPPPLELLPSADECGDGYYMSEELGQITLCPTTCDSIKQREQSLAWTVDCTAQ